MLYFFAVLAFIALELVLYYARRGYTLWVLIGLSCVCTAGGVYSLSVLRDRLQAMIIRYPDYGIERALAGYTRFTNIALAVVLGFLALRLAFAFLPNPQKLSGLFVGIAIAMVFSLQLAGSATGYQYLHKYYDVSFAFSGGSAAAVSLLNWMFPIQKCLRLYGPLHQP